MFRSEYEKRITFSDAASADVFSTAVFDGLVSLNVSFQNVNVPPVGYFPKLSNTWRIPAFKGSEDGVGVTCVGFTNLPLYQDYSIYRQVYGTLLQLGLKEAPVFLVYSINIPVIHALLKFRKNVFPGCKIVLIIPDLIEDMYAGDSVHSVIRRWMSGDVSRLYREMDAFVYLTEQMKEATGVEKPYCVVEGIYNERETYLEPEYDTKEKTVFYSGKLEDKFGVRRLVDAFMMIHDPHFRLALCGSGDSESYIREKAAGDSRIVLYGQLPRKKVLEIQANSTLLVNPRTPEGRFTRFSFPSKNIQYLASGIPTLAYKLPGIPEEYGRFCRMIPEDCLSVEYLASQIQEMCLLDSKQREQIGQSSRRFILREKNSKRQCQKILDLLESLN